VPQDVLPPPAAITAQPDTQGASPADPVPSPSASDSSD
jgi:hypothetical protein